MTTEFKHLVEKTVRYVVRMLVSGNYHELDQFTSSTLLDAEQLKAAILEYPEKLTEPPDEVYKNIDLVKINNSDPVECSVWIDLFTQDGARSDLQLRLNIADERTAEGFLRTRICDVLVP